MSNQTCCAILLSVSRPSIVSSLLILPPPSLQPHQHIPQARYSVRGFSANVDKPPRLKQREKASADVCDLILPRPMTNKHKKSANENSKS